MPAADGKMRLTDVADTEQLFRLYSLFHHLKPNHLKCGWPKLALSVSTKLKILKKENLRDHMSNLELVLNMLAEATTTEISKEKKPVGFENNRKIARQGVQSILPNLIVVIKTQVF
jgi:hypothetical protein